MPDHGEVWSLPWAVEAEGNQIRLGVEGVRLPYRMEKTVHLLGEGRVRLTYRLLNRSPFDMPFVWSSHPLFALRPGMRVDLPCSAVRVDLAARFAAAHGDRLRWPVTADGLDLSRVPDASAGLAVKLFAETGPEGWAALVDPDDGASFRFEFDPAQITHLGLWLNYGGWAGSPGAAPYYTLALEPCIGAPDALDAAVRHWRAHGLAPAEGACTWWLELRAR
jgi:galactose mutarotase-like enzyme